MAKKQKIIKRKATQELDGIYLLKLVLYLIIGAQWVWFVNPSRTSQIPLPLGLIIGAIFAAHDHFQIDRKIEYAVLLIAMFIGFWSQIGTFVTV